MAVNELLLATGFAKPRELAQAIYKLEDTPYRDVASAAAALARALQGGRCPDRLRKLILRAIETKLGGSKADKQSIVSRWETMLDGEEIEDSPTLRCQRGDWSAVLRGIRHSHTVVAIVPEGVPRDPCAEAVFEEMVKRLGLDVDAGEPDGAKFEVLVPDDARAADFWDDLIMRVAQNYEGPISVTKERAVCALRGERSKLLSVLVVPPHICTQPALVFEPDVNVPESKGFTFDWSESGLHLSQLSADSLRRWKRFIRLPLAGVAKPVGIEKASLLAGPIGV